MAIFTTTSRCYREQVDEKIECIWCKNLMLVEHVTGKRNKHYGYSATCKNGCRDDEGELMFFAYLITDLQAKIKRFDTSKPH
jgi:hypothetical protein